MKIKVGILGICFFMLFSGSSDACDLEVSSFDDVVDQKTWEALADDMKAQVIEESEFLENLPTKLQEFDDLDEIKTDKMRQFAEKMVSAFKKMNLDNDVSGGHYSIGDMQYSQINVVYTKSRENRFYLGGSIYISQAAIGTDFTDEPENVTEDDDNIVYFGRRLSFDGNGKLIDDGDYWSYDSD